MSYRNNKFKLFQIRKHFRALVVVQHRIQRGRNTSHEVETLLRFQAMVNPDVIAFRSGNWKFRKLMNLPFHLFIP